MWSLVFLGASAAPVGAAPPLEVRVGLLAYEDFHQEVHDYERLFAKLGQASAHAHSFSPVPRATYADILHWLDHKQTSMWLVSAGIVAKGMWAGVRRRQAAAMPIPGHVAAFPGRIGPLPPGLSRPCGFDTLRLLDDLKRTISAKQVELLFVDPLSISGRFAPEFAMRQRGIHAAPNRVTFTYSHSNSLRLLLEKKAGAERIAFVWDGALGEVPEAAGQVRRLPFAELDQLWIPQDAVIARPDFEQAGLVRSLLTTKLPGRFRFLDDWKDRYGTVAQWISGSAASESAGGQPVSLAEMGASPCNAPQSQPRPPRLALVLSGGGAKCSFQVGAVAALEEELARLRQQFPATPIDIGLVIGTSGGAINALPVALGASTTGPGRAAFRAAWLGLDQRAIVAPSLLVRANIGLWFALAQIALVLWWTKRRHSDDAGRRAAARTKAFLLFGIAEIAVGYLPFTPWRFLGTNHVWHHIWLWCTFGLDWSAWVLVALGAANLITRRRGGTLAAKRSFVWPAICAGLLGLPLVQILTVLFYEQTLSGGSGIERALSEQFPRLIDAHLKANGLPPLDLAAGLQSGERLKATGRQIVERKLLKRDLVITGSCLAQSASDLPGDLYFYAQADSSQPAYRRSGAHDRRQ